MPLGLMFRQVLGPTARKQILRFGNRFSRADSVFHRRYCCLGTCLLLLTTGKVVEDFSLDAVGGAYRLAHAPGTPARSERLKARGWPKAV